VIVLAGLVIVTCSPSTSAAAPSNTPPPTCDPATYEWLKSATCLVQSRALTLTLKPKILKPGEIITATVTVTFPSPPNSVGAPGVRWSWDTLARILGPRQPGCGPEQGSSPLISRCRFKVGSVTGGWRTVQFEHGTFQGPAFSRDYYAVATGNAPTTKPKSKPRKPVTCPKPSQIPDTSVDRAPAGAIARVVNVDGKRAWIQHDKSGLTKQAKYKAWIYPGDIILTDKNTVVAVEYINGGYIGINKDVVVRFGKDGSVEAIPDPLAANPALEQSLFAKKQVVNKLQRVWKKMSTRKEPLEIETAGGVLGGPERSYCSCPECR
jgi:hypothetical protein